MYDVTVTIFYDTYIHIYTTPDLPKYHVSKSGVLIPYLSFLVAQPKTFIIQCSLSHYYMTLLYPTFVLGQMVIVYCILSSYLQKGIFYWNDLQGPRLRLWKQWRSLALEFGLLTSDCPAIMELHTLIPNTNMFKMNIGMPVPLYRD